MAENSSNQNPNFNSALGAVILIDKLHSHASGFLIDMTRDNYEQMQAYYNVLEGLWFELEYWATVKNLTEKEEIEIIRDSLELNPYNIKKLKQYHLLVNRVCNKAGLRLQKTIDPENQGAFDWESLVKKALEGSDL